MAPPSVYSTTSGNGERDLPQRTRVLYTFGYLCVEWTVGAAMGCMVGGPALLAIAQQIGTVRLIAPPTAECAATGQSPCYDTTDIGDMGLATTALAIGNLLGSAVGGPLVDRMVKWNRVIVCAVCLNGGSIAAVPYVTQLWHLIAASFFNGFAIGIIEPMLNVGCVRIWPPERSGPLMQVFATTFGAGIFSSPAIVALDLASTGSFHVSYGLVGTLVCMTALAPMLIPSTQPGVVTAWVVRDKLAEGESEDEDEGEGDDQGGGEKARLVQSSGTGESDSSAAECKPGVSGQRSRTELVVKALVAFVIMCYCGAEAAFGAWIPTYSVAAGSTGEAGGAFLASIFWGSFTCGRVLGIPLSLRFAPTEILAADLAGALCVMVALVSLGTRAPDEQALQVLTAIFGLCMACTYPQAKVLPSTYGYAIDGTYMSIIMVAGSLGNVFFVMCVAQLFGALGPLSFCPTILGTLGLTAVASAVIARFGRKR